jgi:hypothetical protein
VRCMLRFTYSLRPVSSTSLVVIDNSVAWPHSDNLPIVAIVTCRTHSLSPRCLAHHSCGCLSDSAPINDFAFVQNSESRVRRATTTTDTADTSTDGQGEPPAADPEEAAAWSRSGSRGHDAGWKQQR